MKICIFGAGAIGGYMGVKLAQAGADVSLVARGPHLDAMNEKGLTLIEENSDPVTVPVTASDNPADLGPQDYVIVTLKAHSVPPVVPKMKPLIGDNTTIVSGVNGDGLSTIVQPDNRAGAIFCTAIITGKFHGTIPATTPTGTRRVRLRRCSVSSLISSSSSSVACDPAI